MINLIIKQPGYSIQIPGTKETKTPSIIDISRVNINIVVTYLKSMGITNYEILYSDKKKEKIPVKEKPINLNNDKINTDKLDSLKNELFEIKKLLKNIVEKQTKNDIDTTLDTKYNKHVRIIKSLKEDEDIDFIPTINTDGLSTVGNLSTKSGKRSDDLDIFDSVNLLKSLKK